MSGFPILDLVIGMIFIFFLLSIICSSAVELWLSIRKARAKMLEEWLKKIFDKQALDSDGNPIVGPDNKIVTVGQAIIDHCMVTALSETGKSTTYISAENFIHALLDKITIIPRKPTDPPGDVKPPPANLGEFREAIRQSKLISGELKRTMLIIANEAMHASEAIKKVPEKVTTTVSGEVKSEIDHFRDRLARWYDTNNERLTGKYKRSEVLPKTIVFAILITVSLNVDTVEISQYFYNNREETRKFADYAVSAYPAYRNKVDSIKKSPVRNTTIDTTSLTNNLNQVQKDIDSLKAALPPNVPMGWKERKGPWTRHIPGWLATILAITLGAPFWFDILNKIANLRGNGPKPVTVEEKKDNR